MSKSGHIVRSLLHRLGVVGPARSRAFPGTGASFLALVAALALALLAPSLASAHYVRPLVRQITGIHVAGTGELTAGSPIVESVVTSSGAFTAGQQITSPGAGIPAGTTILYVGSGKTAGDLFLSAYATHTESAALAAEAPIVPEGLAVDSEDHLWVGEGVGQLDRFNSAYAALEPNALTATQPLAGAGENAERLAIDLSSGAFYISSENAPGGHPGNVEIFSHAGALEHSIEDSEIGATNPTAIAVDSSHGSLYVINRVNTNGPETLFKFNAAGVKENFECKTSECQKYVKGDEITGTYGAGAGGALAVNPTDGDIYVMTVTSTYQGQPGAIEYGPSGQFIREITGQGVPVPPGSTHSPLFDIEGLAVDPVNGDLAVSLTYPNGLSSFAGAVDEFDPSGRFVGQIVEAAGKPLSGAQAVAFDSKGHLYVADRPSLGENGLGAGVVNVYEEGGFLPSVRAAAVTHAAQASVVLNGSVDPESGVDLDRASHQAGIADCHFEYLTEEQFDKEGGFSSPRVEDAPCSKPTAVEIGEGEAFVPVEASISGLTSGVTYRYRLSATQAGPRGGRPEYSAVLAFTAPAVPKVESVSAANISSTFADLEAKIDPRGAATSYHFEYDTRPYTGVEPHGTSVPVPDAAIGLGGAAGNSSESVSQHVGPLTPGTTYYFRVVASNAVGADEAGEAGSGTFVTLPAPVVAGRSYELVTPASKEGGSDMFAQPVLSQDEFVNDEDYGTPSESGNGFLLEGLSEFGSFPGALGGAYVFTRDYEKGEWSYKSLADPALGVQDIGRLGSDQGAVFDPADFSRVAVNDEVGSGLSEAGAQLLDLLGEPGGPYTMLHADPAFHGGFATSNLVERTQIVGASRGLSHVVLESEVSEGAPAGYGDQGCPGAGAVKHGAALCESAGGQLKLVNVRPGGESEPVSECGAALGEGSFTGASSGGSGYHAVSADGSRVFFTAPDPSHEAVRTAGPGCWNGEPRLQGPPRVAEGVPVNAPQLYVRVDGTQTLEVSAPEEGVSVPASKDYPAEYVGASEDGSEVFFATRTWLTANHPSSHDLELYEWQAEGAGACTASSPGYSSASIGCLTRVSVPVGEAGKPNAGEADPAAGAEVIAVLAVAAEGSAVYFTADGVLAANQIDGAHAEPRSCEPQPSSGVCSLYRYQPATASTPAKTTFIAPSTACSFAAPVECGPVSTGDSPSPQPETTRAYTTPDGRYLLFKNDERAIYRYDAVGETLTLISPRGEFTRSAPTHDASGPVRAMSNDGSYVFFDTPAALVPEATNGTLDVYQWHDGTISLLGSGSEPDPSFFLGYSPYVTPGGETIEGGNVFIGTHDRLVPQDTNSIGNIYDARICVAQSPCIKPPTGETAQCLGDTCQTPPPAPSDPTASLLAPPAPLTLAPVTTKVTKKTTTTCKKGYVRKKVKKKETCIRKPKKSAHKSAKGRK